MLSTIVLDNTLTISDMTLLSRVTSYNGLYYLFIYLISNFIYCKVGYNCNSIPIGKTAIIFIFVFLYVYII